MRLRKGRIFGLFSVILLLGVAAAPFIWVKRDAVVPGVRINGMKAGGMTRDELERLFEEKNQALAKGKLELVKDDLVHEEWNYKDLNVRYDEKSLDEAMVIGRQGNIFKEWKDRWAVLLTGKAAHIDADWDSEILEKKTAELMEKYGKPAENAYPSFHKDGSITFSHGRPHLEIIKEDLALSIGAALRAGKSGKVEIPVSGETKPNMSPEEAKEIDTILGRYTTYFGGDSNRSSNIRLAAEHISGTYLKPGGDFSYNQSTGSRSAENGYKEAPVIINGKLEPGSGGGVCQVSSTLFNATLLAGLQITDRTCHFSPVAYVPIGRDATVAEGYLDFRFINHLKHGIYVYAEYAPGQVTVFILGNKEDKPSYVDLSKTQDETLPFKTVTKIDPSQKEARKVEEGHEGRNVTIQQTVKWADGRTYQDSFLSDYEPVDTVITLNKKEEPKPAPKAKKKSEKKK